MKKVPKITQKDRDCGNRLVQQCKDERAIKKRDIKKGDYQFAKEIATHFRSKALGKEYIILNVSQKRWDRIFKIKGSGRNN